MILISGSASKKLAENVAKEAKIELCGLKRTQFPDSEIYLRILTNVEKEDCVVIQSTPSNDALVELIILLDTLNDLKAKSIHTIIPYMGYSRQDKRFLSGEAMSAKTILKILDYKSDKITTVNAHFLSKLSQKEYEGIKVENLTAFPALATYFKSKLKSPVLVAPDRGALGYVEEAASVLKCEFGYFEKKRISAEKVEMQVKDLKVNGKDTIILDDIISTGGTMVKAAQLLKEEGAKSVNIGCVHGVLNEGLEKVSKAAEEVICTDSILREKFSKVSLAKLIAENL